MSLSPSSSSHPSLSSLLELFLLQDEAFLTELFRRYAPSQEDSPEERGEKKQESASQSRTLRRAELLSSLRNGRLTRLEILAHLLQEREDPRLFQEFETILSGPFLHGENDPDPFQKAPSRRERKGVLGSLAPHASGTLSHAAREELMLYGPEEFLYRAYGTLLGRDPDPQGKELYLDQLLTGVLSRDEILCQLLLSPEGRARKARVEGLRCSRLRLLWARVRTLRLPGTGYSRRRERERRFNRLEYQLESHRRELYEQMERERERTTRSLDQLLSLLASLEGERGKGKKRGSGASSKRTGKKKTGKKRASQSTSRGDGT